MVPQLLAEQLLRAVQDCDHATQRLDAAEIASETALALLDALEGLLVAVPATHALLRISLVQIESRLVECVADARDLFCLAVRERDERHQTLHLLQVVDATRVHGNQERRDGVLFLHRLHGVSR